MCWYPLVVGIHGFLVRSERQNEVLSRPFLLSAYAMSLADFRGMSSTPVMSLVLITCRFSPASRDSACDSRVQALSLSLLVVC
jgi:hypothetical protein